MNTAPLTHWAWCFTCSRWQLHDQSDPTRLVCLSCGTSSEYRRGRWGTSLPDDPHGCWWAVGSQAGCPTITITVDGHQTYRPVLEVQQFADALSAAVDRAMSHGTVLDERPPHCDLEDEVERS